jgi:HEAT repeat protein
VLAARAALIERTTGKLSDATLRAAETLLDLLDDESSSVRLGAARALLDTARRYIEAGDMAERIAALEEAVRQHQPALQALEGGKQSA